MDFLDLNALRVFFHSIMNKDDINYERDDPEKKIKNDRIIKSAIEEQINILIGSSNIFLLLLSLL